MHRRVLGSRQGRRSRRAVLRPLPAQGTAADHGAAAGATAAHAMLQAGLSTGARHGPGVRQRGDEGRQGGGAACTATTHKVSHGEVTLAYIVERVLDNLHRLWG